MTDTRISKEELDLHRAFGHAVTEMLAQQQTLFHQFEKHKRELGHEFTHALSHALSEQTRTIMSALDDLKKNIADLIAEGTADLTAVVQKLKESSQHQGGVSEDEIEELAQNVARATETMHTTFLAATGVPVPETAPSGAPSNATSDSSSAAPDKPSDAPESAGTTTISPESFKSGA
jgi:gas vesicle protein